VINAFRRSGAVVLLAALAGPSWNVIVLPLPGASLTVGRGLIALAALLLVLDLRRAEQPLPRVPGAVWLLLGGLALLWVWIVANALLWGCRCSGEIAGFSELIALVALAALIGTFAPRLRPMLVLAIIGGAAIVALMTLVGIEGLSAGTQSTSPRAGRLAGPYGNPNFLAFAIGLAIPAAIVTLGLWRGRGRVLLACAVVLLSVELLLTFSRSGLLAVAVGSALVLVLMQRRGSAARWLTIAAVVVAGVAGAVAYPVFAEQRRESASAQLEARLRALDRSGWNAGAQGLIPRGPARMRNAQPRVLEVRGDRAGVGISRRLPVANAGDVYDLRLQARAVAGQQALRFGLEDNLQGNGPSIRTTTLGNRWQRLSVRWVPTRKSANASLYIWTPRPGAGFQVRDVATVVQRPGRAPDATAISTVLSGSRFGELKAEQARIDARDINSREVGIDLALDAFKSQPVRGIGWGTFPDYSSANSKFRGLPTHNEYLRFLAELGVPGAALLALIGLVVASTFWRRRLDAMSVALLGMLVTGAVVLAFANGLVVPAVAAPLGFAAALACARAGAREDAELAEMSDAWRPGGGASPPRPRWPDPAPIAAAAAAAVDRVRAAAPAPAPARVAPSVHGIGAGVTQVRMAAPGVAPEGWTTWFREAEHDLGQIGGVGRSVARGLRGQGARMLERRRAVTIRIGSRTAWALGIGALALIARFPLMRERHEILPGGDSTEYVGLARTFFDQSSVSSVRPPGYPLFLALSDALPGRLEDAAIILQLSIGAALCAAVVFFSWPLFGRLAAICAGLLLALSSPHLSIEALLLADMLFGVIVTLVAGLLVTAMLDDARRLRWLLASAVAIACAAYVKPVGHALVLAPLIPLALATRSWRKTLLGSGVVVAIVALLTVPWMARNEARYGSFAMSAQVGQTLFNRVFERDRIEIPTTTRVGRLAAEFQRTHPEQRLSSGVAAELVRRGDTRFEAERKMGSVALEAARRSPATFAAGTARSTYQVYTDVAKGEQTGEAMLTSLVVNGPLPELTRAGFHAAGVLQTVWLVLSLGGLAAVAWLLSRSRRTRLAGVVALSVWACIAVGTAVTHGGQFRYSAGLAPLTFLLGAAGLAVVVRAALELLGIGYSGRPSRRPWVLLRNAATPSGATDTEVRSSAG
jgi:4-amino-4-deoxy-L-arabinose transferase-like glycosyltransferase